MTQLAHTVTPPHLPESKMGFDLPAMRGYELPELVSVNVHDLFDDIPEPIHNYGEDVTPVRRATEKALASVDFSSIASGDRVNVLCSEHGFGMMGGAAYAEMLKTIRDVLVERTGCSRIKLGFACGLSRLEAAEILPEHGLDTHFEGKTFSIGPYDKGVAIDTEIGRLYGIGSVFKADKIIHAHYDDPREIHFHRLNGRAMKAFTMSYARLETRAVYHQNFPTKSANIVPRMIYQSDFVQKKFAFSATLSTSPARVAGVEADNDLTELDRRISINTLKTYGKLIKLFEAIDECIVLIDGYRWLNYVHAGGMTSCNLFFGPQDYLDLDLEIKRSIRNSPVKAIVLNYMWKQAFAMGSVPVISAQPSITRLFQRRAVEKAFYGAESLTEAMQKAYELAGTDKVIVFDGTYGAINCSPSLANDLLEKAPGVAAEVENHYLPKWARQRGLTLDT
mgnify:FL=1